MFGVAASIKHHRMACPHTQVSSLPPSLSYSAGVVCLVLCSLPHKHRLSSLLQQPSDEPVAVRLVAFAAALLPVIFATGLAYRYASGSSLSEALYKVRQRAPLSGQTHTMWGHAHLRSVWSYQSLPVLTPLFPRLLPALQPPVVLCCAVLFAPPPPKHCQMYCLLIRVEAGPEPNRWSYLVTNIVFLVGFFTLAVLLGERQQQLGELTAATVAGAPAQGLKAAEQAPGTRRQASFITLDLAAACCQVALLL